MSLLFNNSVAEPLEPTDEAIVEEPIEDNAEVAESEIEDQQTEDEVETPEGEAETDEVEEDQEGGGDDVYIVDGQEFTKQQLENAKDIEATKKSMDTDYRQKTMALADERKALGSQRDNLDKLAQELEVLVGEDKDVNWEELKEDDIYEYTERKDRAEKRAKKLAEAKSNLAPETPTLSQEEIAAEQQALIEAFPEWVKRDNKGAVVEVLPKYQEDLKAVSAHAIELGFTEKQLSEINTAPIIKALMNSMKSKEKAGKIEIAKKRVAPKSTKPSKKAAPAQRKSLFSKSIK